MHAFITLVCLQYNYIPSYAGFFFALVIILDKRIRKDLKVRKIYYFYCFVVMDKLFLNMEENSKLILADNSSICCVYPLAKDDQMVHMQQRSY